MEYSIFPCEIEISTINRV